MVNPIVSQQVETMKTKLVLSQREESNVTQHSSVGSLSSEISLIVTLGGDQVADMNTEHIEKVISVAAKEPKGIRENGS